MKIKLLIASCEADYVEHLSNSISEHYADVIDVSACRTQERLCEMLKARKFDVALLDEDFAEGADLSTIALPLLLSADRTGEAGAPAHLSELSRYQRVSSIVSEILAKCARVSQYGRGSHSERACVTAVWSPAGGVGKTTVALSYAAKKVSEGKQVLYLNLEPFSSVPAYFYENGKSISTVFEMLDSGEGNIKMLIRGISQQDRGAGVGYFCRPENFDDMYALSAENIAELTTVCAGVTDELVIDMSCVCDWRTRKVFDLADKVLIVSDATATAEVKLSQFTSQHNVFESIKDKALFVANKGAEADTHFSGAFLRLPVVLSTDPTTVYKTLSASLEI
ncbi:MAG: hypothetical protein FWB97_03120 [Oscillospiraceae bacterium]|nr:hypothetical protein [Oscillospiraceae bacterium]